MNKVVRRERHNSSPLVLGVPMAGDTALLLLNWQMAALSPNGWFHHKARQLEIDLAMFDVAAGEALQLLTDVVLPACRTNGLEIIHQTSTYWLSLGADKDDRLHPAVNQPVNPELASFLQVERDDLAIASTSLSPFNSTNIDLLLHNLEIKQLLIAGLLTNQAVELTAADARDRGYEVVVIEDSCAGLSPELHQAALGRIRSAGIATAKTAVVVDCLQAKRSWPDSVTAQVTETHSIMVPDPEPLFNKSNQSNFPLDNLALITVDMQNLNAHPNWGVGKRMSDLGSPLFDDYFVSVRSILSTIRSVQDTFRDTNLPLIHLRTACHFSDERDSGRGRQANRRPMAALGTKETEFLPEVAPIEGEIVINKTSWGVFNSTDIERILYQLSIRILVLVGVVTNGCVEMAARDALDRGFKVMILEDATTTRTADLHSDALYRLENCGARIKKSKTLFKYLIPEVMARDIKS